MRIIKYIITLSVILFIAGCEIDNYEPPKSFLEGKVVYNNQSVGVRSNGVQLELWQPGYALFSKIPVFVSQDGSFSASVFDGDYKLVRLEGAPWAGNTDTINVQVRGRTIIEVPVDPYFIINNVSFEHTGSTSVSATFSISQINTSKNLERVRLYIGETLIVDQNNQAANAEILANAITLGESSTITVNIPASVASNPYLFARVGVKASGVNEYFYSAPSKIELK